MSDQPTYFKAVDPRGRDFRTGRIDYLAEGVIEHPEPARKGTTDAAGYLSVATVPTDCTGFSWPARLLEVEAVGPVWTPHTSSLPNKRAVKALRVVGELDPLQLLGPQGKQLVELVERAKTLTYDEAQRLAEAWDAAWAAARDAARDAARAATWAATRDAAGAATWAATRAATWDAAWAAARDAAWDAASGLVVRDRIGQDGYTQEHYDRLTGPWRHVIGPIHPDDVDLRTKAAAS